MEGKIVGGMGQLSVIPGSTVKAVDVLLALAGLPEFRRGVRPVQCIIVHTPPIKRNKERITANRTFAPLGGEEVSSVASINS